MASFEIEKRCVFPLFIISLIILGVLFNVAIFPMYKINLIRSPSTTDPPARSVGTLIPRFAYLIAGSKGDLEKLWRILLALYHPRNHYVVHLDLESPAWERLELASRIRRNDLFSKIGNVFMITKADIVTYSGPSMVSNTLHACAILLRKNNNWDWFINLSASDYPLVTQDDLLYAFSSVNRSLNFIKHTSRLTWKAQVRAKPMFIDHAFEKSTKQNLQGVKLIDRKLPTEFKMYTGSAWMGLSRSFVEYFIIGWDNLPRTMLMYFTNTVETVEFYFHTLICNAPEFAPTAVNSDLHYITWDKPPGQHPRTLKLKDMTKMIASGAPFGRKFRQDDRVLDKIDMNLLGRVNGSFTPGAWCLNYPLCTMVGNIDHVKPGLGAVRINHLLTSLLNVAKMRLRQCAPVFII